MRFRRHHFMFEAIADIHLPVTKSEAPVAVGETWDWSRRVPMSNGVREKNTAFTMHSAQRGQGKPGRSLIRASHVLSFSWERITCMPGSHS